MDIDHVKTRLRSLSTSPSRCLAGLLAMSLLAGLFNQAPARAQDAAPAGDVGISVDTAEARETIDLASFPEPFIPLNGAYLIVWVNVTNPAATAIDYDYCPAGEACFNPSWFEVVDQTGATFPVDETVRAAFDASEEQGLRFGNEIVPGEAAHIVLVFDVPSGGASWSLHSTDEAATSFSLPLAISTPVAPTVAATLEAGMNQVVPAGGINLMATRAEKRATIDLPSQPAPFVPTNGEYLVVYLTLVNASTGAAEYDICPPGDGRICLNQLWFQLRDKDDQAFPVETLAWSAFSMNPAFLPFGGELSPGTPEPVALVFDVPAGIDAWWLESTPDAPRPFSILLQRSPAPGTIQVVRAGAGGGEPGATPVVELILDTSGSMLQALEGQRRIDIARTVLSELVAQTIPPGTPLALRVFGDTPESCETNLAAPLQPLDPGAMAGLIDGLDAIDGVKTPIGASLQAVAGDLQGVAGPKIVVLVTDGEETCGGDPAAAIRALAAQGIDARINIVGFAVDDETLKAQFREWAHLGNGQYFDAAGAAELGRSIAAAVQPQFRILNAAGDEVGAGLVDGDPVEVPSGTYRVEVLAAQTDVLDNVVVTSGARTDVSWGGR
jgi:hypothetical protein